MTMNLIPSILLLGRHGQVAWELQRTLQTIGHLTTLGSSDLDLADGEQVRAAVRQIRPQIIVNAAAYTAVDKAESEVELARSINTIAPTILAEEAKKLGALLVHYSTDYIFDGRKNGAYVEEDATNPLSIYGQTKLEGEQGIQAIGGDHLILRTTWVYGNRGKNFLLTILRLAAERPELKIVADQIGAPTWSRSIATVTGQILSQWPQNSAPGVYHLSGGGATSWHGFAEKIVEYAQKYQPERVLAVQKILPIGTSDYPTPAQRPANSRLDNSKLHHTFGLGLPDWEQDLALAMAGID
jgi:dTDP-4-dehydrorhamnose reductase